MEEEGNGRRKGRDGNWEAWRLEFIAQNHVPRRSQISNLFAAAAGCPTGCDTCALDANNVVTCTTNGCSAGWFYAYDKQCIGEFFLFR